MVYLSLWETDQDSRDKVWLDVREEKHCDTGSFLLTDKMSRDNVLAYIVHWAQAHSIY